MMPKDKFDEWFQQFRTITGASTKEHPAPFPLELASRIVQMFSFAGDTVLDPFCGNLTTMVTAPNHERNSIGIELDTEYCKMAASRLINENTSLFGDAGIQVELKSREEVMGAHYDGNESPVSDCQTKENYSDQNLSFLHICPDPNPPPLQ